MYELDPAGKLPLDTLQETLDCNCTQSTTHEHPKEYISQNESLYRLKSTNKRSVMDSGNEHIPSIMDLDQVVSQRPNHIMKLMSSSRNSNEDKETGQAVRLVYCRLHLERGSLCLQSRNNAMNFKRKTFHYN